MYEKPINGEHEIVKKNLYLCTTFLNFPSTLLIFVFGTLFISGGQGKMRFDWRTLYCPAMIASYLSILIVVTGWVPSVLRLSCWEMSPCLLRCSSSARPLPISMWCWRPCP